ncbi:hypothetical protein ACSNOH_13845 [Streptomyces sp. URMC 127]|uniref:hypothetical protein n=1 Tax=Streptomyces sp. URMC 127 TaxID=3423402 RepID=UPI003F1DA889
MPDLIGAATARLSVPEGQYAILDPGAEDAQDSIPDPGELAATGLFAAGTDGALVITGTDHGEISIGVELWSGAPPVDDTAWEDIAEDSYTATGAAQVHNVEGRPAGLPDLAWSGPGTYRMRVSVRGRDLGADDDGGGYDDGGYDDGGAYDGGADARRTGPVEEHLIQVWPAPVAPPQALKLTDELGETWRSEAAGG